MAILLTPQLSVFKCTYSTPPPPQPRKISFVFNKPYAATLYLATLFITEDMTINGVSGNIAPGNLGPPLHPGTCSLQMGSGMFCLLYNYVSSHPKSTFEVELKYSDIAPFPVSDMFCNEAQISPASEATVQAIHSTAQAIQASLGTGNISANLEVLNHTAQALLHAITHATRVASLQQRYLDSDPPAATDSDPPPRLDSALDNPKAS
jgi:hypothetical protein